MVRHLERVARSGPDMGPPSLPPYAFVVVRADGRGDRPGAGLGVNQVIANRLAIASGLTLLPEFFDDRRPTFVTQRVWHKSHCPVCYRGVTFAVTQSA